MSAEWNGSRDTNGDQLKPCDMNAATSRRNGGPNDEEGGSKEQDARLAMACSAQGGRNEQDARLVMACTAQGGSKEQDARLAMACTAQGGSKEQDVRLAMACSAQGGSKDVALCSGIKSTAVVKFESVEMPERFQKLQRDTNLNAVPSHWTNDDSQWDSYIQRASLRRQRTFSSFKMMNWHCYPELMEEIDVVSDSENIKQLLKMPYSDASVSLMVHRVGNTLMLDEFDVHRHLLQRQESAWPWLRAFFSDTVRHSIEDPRDQQIVVRRKTSQENQLMFSKFLYHSMTEAEQAPAAQQDQRGMTQSLDQISKAPQPTAAAAAAAATNQTKQVTEPRTAPKAARSDHHQRTVVWSFENLQMLIGTDLPIFGGGTRPCISLRLRDSGKPINVLTGLDYWLDNLMCNVPEMAMCYHHNGIVQHYELLKTEDIPNLENSKFSPVVVKDIAQNILSFLKRNATKEGHTYWLFKGENDDIVKLYDLTTVCSPFMHDDQTSNPFTVPVGILLYRVARSMWLGRSTRSKSNVIRMLLSNCVELLDKEKHAQVVASAHFMMSDIYVADDNLFGSPEPSVDENEESDAQEEFADDDSDSLGGEAGGEGGAQSAATVVSVEVAALSVPGSVKRPSTLRDALLRYPPITGDRERRCREALLHIAQGLESLERNETAASSSSKYVVEDQAQCNPNTAIPLGYRPLNPPDKPDNAEAGLWDFPCGGDEMPLKFAAAAASCAVVASSVAEQEQWAAVSKGFLLRKAAVVYHSMGKAEAKAARYDRAMKVVSQALLCFESMKWLSASKATENGALLGAIFGLGGAVQYALHHLSRDDFSAVKHRYDQTAFGAEPALLGFIESAAEKSEYPWLHEFPSTQHDALLNSVRCLRVATQSLARAAMPDDVRLVYVREFGSSLNELGLLSMNEAQRLIVEYSSKEESAQDETRLALGVQLKSLWDQCRRYFSDGIDALRGTSETMVGVVLHSNLARLCKLSADSVAVLAYSGTAANRAQRRELTAEEKGFYMQAASNYKMALDLLGARVTNPGIWDSITWDLSSIYFNLATLLQDFSPSTHAQQTIEAEIRDLMGAARMYCDCDTPTHRQVTAQYRTATILHRLAAMHHNAMRNETSEQRRKAVRVLAERDYEEASRLFHLLESPGEYLRVQLERLKIFDSVMENQTGAKSRAKTLQSALECILACYAPLLWLDAQLHEEHTRLALEASGVEGGVSPGGGARGAGVGGDGNKDVVRLLELLLEKLRETLKLLNKYVPSRDKKCDETAVARCKAMYAASLMKKSDFTVPTFESTDVQVISDCRYLLAVLERVKKLHQSPGSF